MRRPCTNISLALLPLAQLPRTRIANHIHLILRFDHSKQWQRLFVGPQIHVDTLIHAPGTQHKLISYTAYMYEKFSATLMGAELIENEDHTSIAIPIDQDECERIQHYLMALVGNATYNYKDLALAMGLLGHGTFANTMCEDIDGTDPTKITSVYCSQAVVLLLRYCLNPESNAELLHEINKLNSRHVTPHKLFETVKNLGRECTAASLITDELDFII